MSPDQCPVLPGPLMLSESLKTLVSSKALLTLPPGSSSSADRTLKMSGAGGLSFQREVWLRCAHSVPSS